MSAYNAGMLQQQTPPNHPTNFNISQYPPLPDTPGNVPPHTPVYNNVDPQLGQAPGPTPLKSAKEGNTGQGKARLRKACDSCSLRKVKCDESGPPCKACQGLEVPCTYDRPSKRRGPTNQVAKKLKEARLNSPGTTGLSQPSSPTNAAHTLASFASNPVISADTICHWSILRCLVDDYFTHIHPLVQLPHEPSFRSAFERREDVSNPTFLAMLASMIGCLVASFPRKAQQHFRLHNMESLLPTPMSLVERCHRIALEAQGVGYLDKNLTIHDAVTSYLLGLTSAYMFNRPSCILYFRRCLTILTTVGAHKPNTIIGIPRPGPAPPARMTSNGHGLEGPKPIDVDLVMQEICRRTFWIMFASARSLQQHGVSQWELPIPPATKSEPYPPLPMEVDDEYLTPTSAQQPPNIVSRLTGFNANIRLYTSYNNLATIELVHGVNEVANWEQQRSVLEKSLRAVKEVTAELPPELQTNLDGTQALSVDHKYPSPANGLSDLQNQGHYAINGFDSRPLDYSRPEERAQVQYGIQKSNLCATQLSTRLYLVEKYCNLHEVQKRNDSSTALPELISPALENFSPTQTTLSMSEDDLNNEREELVKSFISLLNSINQSTMESNGASFSHRIRQLASTLLDLPRSRKGPLLLRAETYLRRFKDILMQLERVQPSNDTFEDEEAAYARRWNELRDLQARFAQAGEFRSQV